MRISVAKGVLTVVTVSLAGLCLRAAPPDEGSGRPVATATAPAGAPSDAQAVTLPGVAAGLTEAFRPVRRPVRLEGELCGYVDWTTRTVVAVGEAPQQGRGSQAALKARRAAGLIAIRNAMALAAGIQIGPNGKINRLPRGTVILQGYLKDFEITRTSRREVKGQTVWTAEAQVPMFGIEHVAGRLYGVQARAYDQMQRKLHRGGWTAPEEDSGLVGDLLVVDARGTGLSPSMYPMVRSADGRILIDMLAVAKPIAIQRGPAVYATTDLSFERLAARATASSPSTGPLRQPRVRAVRAARAEGQDKTTLVIADEEADRLLKDRAAAAAALEGRVVILVEDEPGAAGR